ncbi:hypothetical protein [Acidithiobacillus sp.]|uniref:hypothetical protein n=1 Tax=Acidithiobacillus sp. TaxID=1872118 RepID=UPI003CFC9F77
MAKNPMVPQGNLNKVRGSVIVPGYPGLNINASHLGLDGISLDLDEDFVDQIKTMTGVVNSPQPYVMATCTINLLRTQALALQWMQQAEANASIGRIAVHSDTAAYTQRRVHNCSALHASPGRMNGTTATVDLVIRGVYYINNNMWNLL